MHHTPVIAIADPDTDDPDLAVHVMQKGATDYIRKPFPKVGRTLDEVIKSALAPTPTQTSNTAKPTDPPKPFTGGELTFFEHHVELCGVTILEDTARGCGWAVLDALRQQRNGKYVSHSGGQLARLIDKQLGENTISQCIVSLRKRISDTMLRERNFIVGKHDIIANKGHGYRFNADKITIRQEHEEGHCKMSPVTSLGHSKMSPVTFVTGNVPNNVTGDIAGGVTSQMSPVTNAPKNVTGDIASGEIGRGQEHSGDIFNERQTWFIDELQAGRSPQRTDIEEKFGCSDRTAKRDLIALRNYGTIEFVPLPRPGHYRLKTAKFMPPPAPT